MKEYLMKDLQNKRAKEVFELALKIGFIGKNELIDAYGDKSIMGLDVNNQEWFEKICENIYYGKIVMSNTLAKSCHKKKNNLYDFIEYMYCVARSSN